ncbi:MAG: PIN domain protein [Akkermansiaceae bacterium]
MLIYLDNCCFNRPFDEQNQVRILLETEAKLVVQERIREGSLEFAWSFMMDFENEANPFEERRNSISIWKHLVSTDVSESESVIERAESITKHGIKPKDAGHLACAIEAHCDVFLSTDKGILNKANLISELAIINPVDYNFNNNDD